MDKRPQNSISGNQLNLSICCEHSVPVLVLNHWSWESIGCVWVWVFVWCVWYVYLCVCIYVCAWDQRFFKKFLSCLLRQCLSLAQKSSRKLIQLAGKHQGSTCFHPLRHLQVTRAYNTVLDFLESNSCPYVCKASTFLTELSLALLYLNKAVCVRSLSLTTTGALAGMSVSQSWRTVSDAGPRLWTHTVSVESG